MIKTKLIKWLKNPYFLLSIGFFVWLSFFDSEDWLSQRNLTQQIKKLQAEKAYYQAQISIIKKERQELMSDEVLLEKFAREKYFMKKPTEDVYVIEEDVK